MTTRLAAASATLVGSMKPCLLCGSATGPPSTEHVIPRWVRKAFNVPGSLTLYASDGVPDARRVAGLPALNITVDEAICEPCNNGPLSHLEKRLQPVLGPMIVEAQRTTLDPTTMKLLATWAVKTVWLFELAVRQHYPTRRAREGYVASDLEFAWLWKNQEPPPRSLIWLGCWDCEQRAPITYEPSRAYLPTPDGRLVPAHLTTMSVGYVALQVFTVDFVAADTLGCGPWNTRPPHTVATSLQGIWPLPAGGTSPTLAWPPPAFPHDD